MNLIKINNLKVFANNKIIINNLNINIAKNETLCIIGKSGVGKTSLLKAILGLIDFDGQIIKKTKNISYMPQEFALFDNKTVLDNVTLPLAIKNKVINEDYVLSILKDLKIDNLKNKKVNSISGGEKSRVALARSIVNNSDLILLDEPLSKLDYFTKKETLDLLKKIKTKYNISYIYVTHDLKEVESIANRVLILKENEYIISNKLLEEELLENFK